MVVEGTFSKKEILGEFEKYNIIIPESLLNDFNNRIIDKMKKRYGL